MVVLSKFFRQCVELLIQARFIITKAALFPQEHTGAYKLAGTDLHLGVISKAMTLHEPFERKHIAQKTKEAKNE